MRRVNLFILMFFVVGLLSAQKIKGDFDLSGIKVLEQAERGSIACGSSSLDGNPFNNPDNYQNATGSFKIANSFSTVGGSIDSMRIWGINAFFNGSAFEVCEKDTMIIDVSFYENINNQLGNLITEFTGIPAAKRATAESFQDTYSTFEYCIEFPESVTATTGFWVVNVPDTAECWLMLANTPTGDGQGLRFNQTEWVQAENPYAFCLEGTPASCEAPTDIEASQVTNSSATISWITTGTTFEVAYGLVGFDIETATPEEISENTYEISGLTGSTDYAVYVRQKCGVDDYSEWAYTTFTTLCDVIEVTEMFTETFEDESASLTCWTQIQETGAKLWSFDVGADPDGNITAAFEGEKNAVFTSTYGGPFITKLVSPVFDLSALQEPTMYFHYGQEMWYGDINSLKVFYRTGLDSSWVELFADNSSVANWTEKQLALPESGNFYQIAFEGTDNFGHPNVIDNVIITEAPTCIRPDSIEITEDVSSAIISWTGAADSYQLAYGLEEFDLNNVVPIDVNTTEYELTGLDEYTFYDVYLRSVCGNDTSFWTAKETFRTLADCGTIANFPYLESFEDTSSWRNCWSQIQEQGIKEWSFEAGCDGGSVTTAYDGSLNARFTASSDGPHITKLVSPVMDLTSVVYPTLTFYYAQEDWLGDQNELKVYYRESTNNDWVEIFYNNANVPTWTEQSMDLPNPTATYQIAFEGIDNYGHENVIDNVTIDAATSLQKELSQLIKIYPNPADEYFIIDNAVNANIKIYNVSGIMVLNKNITKDNTLIDVSTLSKGAYFAKIQKENQLEVIKVIVK